VRILFLFRLVDKAVDGKVGTEQAADVTAIAEVLRYEHGRMIALRIVLFRKFQGGARTELDAESASFAMLDRNDERAGGFLLPGGFCLWGCFHTNRPGMEHGQLECSYHNLGQQQVGKLPCFQSLRGDFFQE